MDELDRIEEETANKWIVNMATPSIPFKNHSRMHLMLVGLFD